MSKTRKNVQIDFASDGWWDYFVTQEIDGSDEVVGFIKGYKDGNRSVVEFVVGQDEANYKFKSVEDATNFAVSGKW
jgi:hypothetical protein